MNSATPPDWSKWEPTRANWRAMTSRALRAGIVAALAHPIRSTGELVGLNINSIGMVEVWTDPSVVPNCNVALLWRREWDRATFIDAAIVALVERYRTAK